MSSVLLTAAMVVLYSFQSLFTRLYSISYDGPDKDRSTAVFSVCYGLFTALVSWAVNGFGFHASAYTWLFGLLNALVLILYNTAMIRGGNLGSYSFLMMASLFGGIALPLIAGVFFFGESMSLLQWGAVAIMLAAIALMNSKGLTLKNASRKFYFWCALLFCANGLYGVILKLQVLKLDGRESAEMLVILFLFSGLFAAGLECAAGRGKALLKGLGMGRKAALRLGVCCAAAFAAARLMLLLLGRMDSWLLNTIDNGGVLALSFAYSILLFHEKPDRRQLAGMLLAAVSIVLISVKI